MYVSNVLNMCLLVFCRKDLCKANHEMQSVFKFSDVLFALKSDVPPVEAYSGQEQYYVRSAWQLQSDVTSSDVPLW